MQVIPKNLLLNLKEHQYRAVDNSYISKYILQPYWTKVSDFIPTYIHPNTITVSGLFLVILSVLVCMLNQDPKPWMCLLFAVNLFLYQTLDAVDGKQARKTGEQSPLGELVDHVCDALNLGLTTITTSFVMQLEFHEHLIGFMVTLLYFYLSTWETYCTGILHLGYVSGPVEGLLIVCCMFLMGFFFEVSYYQSLVSGLKIHQVMALIASMLIIPNIYGIIKRVKNRESLIPISLFFLSCFSYLGTKQWITFTLCFTLIFSKMVAKVLIAHITKDKFPGLEPMSIVMLIFFWEPRALNFLLALCFLDFGFYAYSLQKQICEFLKIKMFKIKI